MGKLKVGDRVRLTGWNIKDIYSKEDVAAIKMRFNRDFPVECTITSKCFPGGFLVLYGYGLGHFTYEKLPDETPIP